MRARDQLSDLLLRLRESTAARTPGRPDAGDDGFFCEPFAEVVRRLQAEGDYQDGSADEVLAAEVTQLRSALKAQ